MPDRPRSDDHHLARTLASEAGELLLDLRAEHPDLDGRELGKLGDRRSDDLLLGRLADLRPDDAVLSEETADRIEERLAADRVWIVDPLDGTREYGERRSDFGVHVALWERGHGLVAGAVALPALGVTLGADAPSPVPSSTDGPVLVVSRTRAPEWVTDVATSLGGTVLPMGSVGAKVGEILLGRADAYVHTGAMSEWDSAAPAAAAAAAGLHVSRLDGSPLEFNQAVPRTMDVLVCRPELADALLAACAEHHRA